jgi:hypothetical protein
VSNTQISANIMETETLAAAGMGYLPHKISRTVPQKKVTSSLKALEISNLTFSEENL